MKHSLGFLSVLVCMTVRLLTPGEAEAQADTIYACVNNSSGTIKIVDPLELCGRNGIELIWNAAGPEGPQGPPGEQGPPGPPGSIDGSEVFDVFVQGRGGNTSDFVVASFCSLSVVGFTDLRDVEGPKDRECGVIREVDSSVDPPTVTWAVSGFSLPQDVVTFNCRMTCIP